MQHVEPCRANFEQPQDEPAIRVLLYQSVGARQDLLPAGGQRNDAHPLAG